MNKIEVTMVGYNQVMELATWLNQAPKSAPMSAVERVSETMMEILWESLVDAEIDVSDLHVEEGTLKAFIFDCDSEVDVEVEVVGV